MHNACEIGSLRDGTYNGLLGKLDPQKPESVQAMLTNSFMEYCGHYQNDQYANAELRIFKNWPRRLACAMHA